jgi:hypothetical protein
VKFGEVVWVVDTIAPFQVCATRISSYFPPVISKKYRTTAYFLVDILPALKGTRTRLMEDEGVTWCRDVPLAVAALRASEALR